MADRLVRFLESFFDDLDRQLPPDRGADGTPSATDFLLYDHNVAARALLALADARDTVVAEIARAAADSVVPPASVIVFGSFTRHEATSTATSTSWSCDPPNRPKGLRRADVLNDDSALHAHVHRSR